MSKKLDSVLEKLKKNYNLVKENVNEANNTIRIPIDSPGMNFVLGGGWVDGRIYYLQGPESGGKSTISTYLGMQVQKHCEQKTIVYLDYEYSADMDHMRELGLDVDNNFILLRPTTGEDGFDAIKELVETDEVGLVIIDSITSMSSKAQSEDFWRATFGGQANLLSNGLRSINPYLYKHKCSLILISQERQSMSLYGASTKGTGGFSPKYYSSWMGRITRTEDITDKDKGLIGIKIKCKNMKNKLGIPKREATLTLYFNGGIDSDDEYLDYLKLLGLVEQKGSYYSNEEWGMKVQGKNGMAEFLHNNPELYEKIKKQVNDLICKHTSLDSDEEDNTDEPFDSICREGNLIKEGNLVYNEETGEVIED